MLETIWLNGGLPNRSVLGTKKLLTKKLKHDISISGIYPDLCTYINFKLSYLSYSLQVELGRQ